MLENLITLAFLVLLQAVLGFDNLLYISLQSKRAPIDQRAKVRRLGIGLAIFLRIALLFLLIRLIEFVQDPVIHLEYSGVVEGHFNIHSLIVLAGGGFIMYTAVREIWHLLNLNVEEEGSDTPKSAGKVLAMIILMNLVFSFDSILSAIALTDVFWVMAAAIVASGLMMIWLADRVSTFLQRNRMYEVLGLFILFIVGIMLVSEGGHLAHLRLFGSEVTAMTKATFYFVIAVLIIVDMVQSRYQRRLGGLHANQPVAKAVDG